MRFAVTTTEVVVGLLLTAVMLLVIIVSIADSNVVGNLVDTSAKT
jgi:Na+/proline symporter